MGRCGSLCFVAVCCGLLPPKLRTFGGCWQNGKIILRRLLGAHFGHFGGQRANLFSGSVCGLILCISRACWRNGPQEHSRFTVFWAIRPVRGGLLWVVAVVRFQCWPVFPRVNLWYSLDERHNVGNWNWTETDLHVYSPLAPVCQKMFYARDMIGAIKSRVFYGVFDIGAI